MDFAFSEEQTALRGVVRDFARAELAAWPRSVESDPMHRLYKPGTYRPGHKTLAHGTVHRGDRDGNADVNPDGALE